MCWRTEKKEDENKTNKPLHTRAFPSFFNCAATMAPPTKKAKLAQQRNVQGMNGFQKTSEAEAEAETEEAGGSDLDEDFFDSDWQEVTKLLNDEIMWRSGALAAAVGKGDSARNQRRKEQERRERAQTMEGSKAITAYFGSPSDANKEVQSELTIREALKQLDDGVGMSKASNEGVLAYDHARMLTLRVYFTRILNGEKKKEVSESLAVAMWDKGPYHARRICEWANEFLAAGALSQHMMGAHAKQDSLIDDENFSMACKAWLRLTKPEKRSPLELKVHVEKTILPVMDNNRKTISESTCREYMKRWGYTFGAHTKDVYMDGHEREDVQVYRTLFVGRLLDLEPRMSIFQGDTMTEVEPDLGAGVKKLVMVTHDECAFHAHDAQNRLWLGKEEQVLRKKGAGKTLMISGFMCPCHGVVHQKDFEPGKNCEGYWTSAHMIDHVSNLIKELKASNKFLKKITNKILHSSRKPSLHLRHCIQDAKGCSSSISPAIIAHCLKTPFEPPP